MNAPLPEHIRNPDHKVVIDDYVELAKAFFEGSTEPGFVNAALDGVARDVRSE